MHRCDENNSHSGLSVFVWCVFRLGRVVWLSPQSCCTCRKTENVKRCNHLHKWGVTNISFYSRLICYQSINHASQVNRSSEIFIESDQTSLFSWHHLKAVSVSEVFYLEKWEEWWAISPVWLRRADEEGDGEEDEEVEWWVEFSLWQRRSRPQKHKDSSRGTTGIPARAAFWHTHTLRHWIWLSSLQWGVCFLSCFLPSSGSSGSSCPVSMASHKVWGSWDDVLRMLGCGSRIASEWTCENLVYF